MSREYRTLNYSGQKEGGSTFLTGIRAIFDSKEAFISGVYHDPHGTTHGLIFKGLPNGKKGKWYEFDYPSCLGRTVTGTAFYGPDNGDVKDNVRVVGNYNTKEAGKAPIGCMYEGPLDGSGKWTTLNPEPKNNSGTIIHSNSWQLVVGNYDVSVGDKTIAKAFIYNRQTSEYSEFRVPHAKSTTLYGVIYTGCDKYVVCGGYTDKILHGFVASLLVTKHQIEVTNFAKYSFGDSEASIVTHFDGISGGAGGYSLTGDYEDEAKIPHGFYAHIKDIGEKAEWQTVNYPLVAGDQSRVTSGNSVLNTLVIGVYKDEEGKINGYTAE